MRFQPQVVAIFLVLISCAFPILSSKAADATPGSSNDLSSDFSDYVPEYSPEDAYKDESFMYFGKSFLVSGGSGVQAWTGVLGKFFKTAGPILDFRLTSLGDRGSWEFGFNTATYYGEPKVFDVSLGEITGATSMRTSMFYIDRKFYFLNNLVASNSRSTGIVSPNGFFGLGLALLLDAQFELPQHNFVFDLTRISPLSLPIIGRFVPIPLLSAGLDFSLKPRASSLTLEGKWLPIGSLVDLSPWGEEAQVVLDTFFHERRLGDILSFTANVNFMF